MKNCDTAKTKFYQEMLARAKYNREKRFETRETDSIENSLSGSPWDMYVWIVVDKTTKLRVFGSNDIRDCKNKERELNGVYSMKDIMK